MKIEVGSDQGLYKKTEGKRNRKRVYDWFKRNPGKSPRACANALNLAINTVKSHAKAINSEHKEAENNE